MSPNSKKCGHKVVRFYRYTLVRDQAGTREEYRAQCAACRRVLPVDQLHYPELRPEMIAGEAAVRVEPPTPEVAREILESRFHDDAEHSAYDVVGRVREHDRGLLAAAHVVIQDIKRQAAERKRAEAEDLE